MLSLCPCLHGWRHGGSLWTWLITLLISWHLCLLAHFPYQENLYIYISCTSYQVLWGSTDRLVLLESLCELMIGQWDICLHLQSIWWKYFVIFNNFELFSFPSWSPLSLLIFSKIMNSICIRLWEKLIRKNGYMKQKLESENYLILSMY